MRKVFYIIILTVIFILQGCSDDVIEQKPDHLITKELTIHSVDKLQLLLNGSYNEISRGSYLGRNLYKRAAVKGTDFRFVKTTFEPRDYEQTEYRYEENALSGGEATSLWLQSYKVISNLNLILDYIDNAKGNAILKKQIKAQAYALRAMVYFDLVRTFCYPWIKQGSESQGLPLKLSSVDKVVSRSNLGKTYDQIISDFTSGLQLINGNTWKQGSTMFITKIGINALLSRVYLYKQDWNNALVYAEKVIAIKGASNLMELENYVFKDFTSESLFELNIDGNNTVGSNGLGAQFDFRDGGQGDVIATQTFIDLLKVYKDDPRAKLLVLDKEGTKHAFVKYINRDGGAGLSAHNIPVIRLSEVFLIAAEASVNLGDDIQAQSYLNSLIKRRTTNFEAHKATEVSEELKTRIYQERRRELALEGHGVYDYIRTGSAITRVGKDYFGTGLSTDNLKIGAFSPKTIYPIPFQQVQEGTSQTEGY